MLCLVIVRLLRPKFGEHLCHFHVLPLQDLQCQFGWHWWETLTYIHPDDEVRAFSASSGSKLSMPDELEVVNNGSDGVDEPNEEPVANVPNIGADDVTAGSPARAAGVRMTPSDDPTDTHKPL